MFPHALHGNIDLEDLLDDLGCVNGVQIGEEEEEASCRCYWDYYGDRCEFQITTQIIDKLLHGVYFWIPAAAISVLFFSLYMIMVKTTEMPRHVRKIFMDIFHTIWFLATSFILSWWQFPMQKGPEKEWNNGYLLVFFAPLVFFGTALLLELLNPMIGCCRGHWNIVSYMAEFIVWKPDTVYGMQDQKRKGYIKHRIYLMLWWCFECIIHIVVIGLMGYYAMGFQRSFAYAEASSLVGWIGFWTGILSLVVSFLVYIVEMCITGCEGAGMFPDLLNNGGLNVPPQDAEGVIVVVPGTGKCCFKAKSNSLSSYNKCVRFCLKRIEPSNKVNTTLQGLRPLDMDSVLNHGAGMNQVQIANELTSERDNNQHNIISGIIKDIKNEGDLNDLDDL